MHNVKRWLAVGLVAGTLGFGAAPALASSSATAAAPAHQASPGVRQIGLINAILNVKDSLNRLRVLNIKNVKIIYVKHSVYNVVHHNRILNRNVLKLQRFLNNCTVVSCNNILSALNQDNIVIRRVLAVNILSGNTVKVFVKK